DDNKPVHTTVLMRRERNRSRFSLLTRGRPTSKVMCWEFIMITPMFAADEVPGRIQVCSGTRARIVCDVSVGDDKGVSKREQLHRRCSFLGAVIYLRDNPAV